MRRNTVVLTTIITRDFLNGNGDNDIDGKIAEICSNDGVDVDDVGGGKRKS